jgi:hypothetical protein
MACLATLLGAGCSSGHGGGTTSGTSGTSTSGAMPCSYPSAAQLSTPDDWSWRNQCDAGQCTEDTQCRSGYYCDFWALQCANGPFGVIVPGSCLAKATSPQEQACVTGEDCGEGTGQLCLINGSEGGDYCTLETPCTAGTHSCGSSTSPPPPDCPAACPMVLVPHTTFRYCVCPGLSCDAGCDIGGQPAAYGAINPDNFCESCQPLSSSTSWTPTNESLQCGDAGHTCAAGSCG